LLVKLIEKNYILFEANCIRKRDLFKINVSN
jgi:hypothetical protein